MLTPEQTKRIDYLVQNFKPNPLTEAEIAEAMNYETPPSMPQASWRNHPATQKQINYLRALGYAGSTTSLTKPEACQLIARLLREEHE